MTGSRKDANNGDTIPSARDVSSDIAPYADTVFGEASKIATDKDPRTPPPAADEVTQMTAAANTTAPHGQPSVGGGDSVDENVNKEVDDSGWVDNTIYSS